MRTLAGITLFLAMPVALAGWAKFYGDNVRFDGFKLTSDGGMVVLGELSCNEYDDCDPGESRPFNDEA
ncbi:MAG: hypothetical protein N3A55_04230 [Methylohalobius sp.]|nr:hypothetical protein [Methylohalobius sp.]